MPKERRIRFLATLGLWLAASIWLSGETMAERVTPVALEQKELLQVKIYKLITDPTSLQPVVFLADPLEERGLPIWIGQCEANAIYAELQGIKYPRPLTHDLLERIIQKTNWKIQRIVVTHSKEGTYYATMVMERGNSLVEIDARPSDSLVMALKFKAPIFVSKSLFGEMAVPLGEKRGTEELYGLTVQELTPLLAQSFSFESTRGVLVSDIRQGSQAEKDGIQRGDIFVQVGGETMGDVMKLKGALARSKAPVQAMIFRKGNFLSIRLHPPK
jgi:bifunctional DNase/RNase